MTGAIILAAGSGKRMKHSINKQYIDLEGSPILAHSLRTFGQMPEISGILLVIRAEDRNLAMATIGNAKIDPEKVCLVEGGVERQDSVYLALLEAPTDWERVLIHDGARPFVTEDLIRQVAAEVTEDQAVTPGLWVTDSLKKVDENGIVRGHLNRRGLMTVQTPQGFDRAQILHLHERAQEETIFVTDDTGLYEVFGKRVKVVPGDPNNIKLTYSDDMARARMIYHAKEENDHDGWHRL